MSERKINLEEILRNKIGYMGIAPNLTKLISERATGYDVLCAMKEACKQLLELAAENATYDFTENGRGIYVDKQSILDTINQVE